MKKIKENFLNFLFPLECLNCGQENTWLCPDCRLKIPLNDYQACLFCGCSSPAGKTCPACSAGRALDGIFSAGNYEHRTTSLLIKNFKYNFAENLGEILSALVILFLEKISRTEMMDDFTLKNCLLIPLPLHQRRLNWRGFNQAEIIAAHVAKKFSLQMSTELKRSKNTKPQARLQKTERQKNIKGCFLWTGGDLADKKILLIDDVATTGATLEEAAGVLKAAGAKKVRALVVARG